MNDLPHVSWVGFVLLRRSCTNILYCFDRYRIRSTCKYMHVDRDLSCRYFYMISWIMAIGPRPVMGISPYRRSAWYVPGSMQHSVAGVPRLSLRGVACLRLVAGGRMSELRPHQLYVRTAVFVASAGRIIYLLKILSYDVQYRYK